MAARGTGIDATTERPLGGVEDLQFVRAVHAAAETAYRTCANRLPQDAYLALAWELQCRGIEPDPSSVYDAALLISRGERPAVLHIDPYATPTGPRSRLI